MNVIYDWPPNIASVREKFPCDQHTIFTYSPNVYAPSGVHLTLSLQAHEQVHLDQQGNEPDIWWQKYLDDPEFRFQQELEAHRIEWRQIKLTVRDRNYRHRALTVIARRLASPLYGSMVTLSTARRMICNH